MTCTLRACCKRPSGGFISIGTEPGELFRDGSEAPILSTMATRPAPELHVAWHESGHAVAIHGYGGDIDFVTIAGQPRCVGGANLVGIDRIAMALAGPAAEAAYHRRIITLFDNELSEYFRRVDDIVFGGCDACRACHVATVMGGSERRADAFRAGERGANDLVARLEIKAAIRELSAALMTEMTLSGADAHKIIEHHLPRGSVKAV